jgi:hypothetical protein
VSLVLGLGAGIGAAGCGEDRGSVDVEGGTTGGTTVGTTTTPEPTATTGSGGSSGSGGY